MSAKSDSFKSESINDRLSSKDGNANRRAKSCHPGRRKRHYFTSGRTVTEESLRRMQEEILKPYRKALEVETMEDVKKYWEEEKQKKLEERKAHYTKRHTYRSRLNGSWKAERLFVAEEIELPGGSLTEDIDPTFFTIVSGKPIKEKQSLRSYVQDVRDCFLTRLTTGYYMDEILRMNESYENEKRKLNQVRENFNSCLKGFEQFLKEDHESSSKLLEAVKEEEKKSEEKVQTLKELRVELKRAEVGVLVAEEQWRTLRLFQKFLYIISPSEWRKVHDPYYGKEDVGTIASDPCLFDSFREFPGESDLDVAGKIARFQEDLKHSQPPLLYFTDPQELLTILEDLERNNLRTLTHCKDLDFPAEKMMAELQKAKLRLEEDQKSLEEDIEYLKGMVEEEEKTARENEKKMKEIIFGHFRDLITNEEYLTVTSYVEDAYGDAVGSNDGDLDLVTMVREIELKHEALLLALDLSPNYVMTQATRKFFRGQKREMREAREAEKKVHQMEILLKRLSKSLERPKKGRKERRTVPRSLPPEEIMFKYKLPKFLSKEERDELFFFGRTPDDVRLHKPLCL